MLGAQTGSISGVIWLDLNADGTRDADEGVIPEFPVMLYQGDEVIAETVSDNEGLYIFEDLAPGEYRVGIQAQMLEAGEALVCFHKRGNAHLFL